MIRRKGKRTDLLHGIEVLALLLQLTTGAFGQRELRGGGGRSERLEGGGASRNVEQGSNKDPVHCWGFRHLRVAKVVVAFSLLVFKR